MFFGLVVACVPVAGVFVQSVLESKLFGSFWSRLVSLRTWRKWIGTDGSHGSLHKVLLDDRKGSNSGGRSGDGSLWMDAYPATDYTTAC